MSATSYTNQLTLENYVKIKNFEEATKQIQLHLVQYLEKQGIETSRNFKCLNPAHGDSHPSMSLVRPDSIRVYCHGCAATGDIFDVCNWLEKKPLVGQGFMTDTLPYLAKEFDITLEHTELTEEELYEIDTYRAYKIAAEYITKSCANPPEEFVQELKRRGWDKFNPAALADSGIGCVVDHKDFREHLKGQGFSASFLDDVDLGRKDIFAPGHFIFTIKDEAGRPVGFAARDLNWKKGGEAPKYVNQKTTGVKCNIYQKGKRLYGLDRALKFKNEGPVYIMEGYSDVLSCHLNGFNRVVATCGTSLTDDHLYLLKEHGIVDVVQCFDNDLAGQSRTEDLLDNKYSKHKDISVSVLTVNEGKDPDDLIREHGIKAFMDLKPISAFKWRLHRYSEDVEADIICKGMIPLVVSEPSHISREKMLQELSAFTGYNLKTLQAELNRVLNEKEKSKDRERQVILDRVARDVVARPTEAELIISEAQSKLYSLRAKYDEDTMSEESTVRFLADLKAQEEAADGSKLGFYLGPDLHELEVALQGEWRDTLHIYGGKANSGKTSYLVKLAHAIASHEKENNAVVIYHTIDDSAEQLIPKFICVAEGTTKLEINHVKNPKFFKQQVNDFQSLLDRREAGYAQLSDLIRRGRIVIKDANNGASLAYAESLIKYYQDKYPDRQVVYILDNFHKLRDFESLENERTKYKTMSQVTKGLATKYHIPIICTMEYTKLPAGVKPSNDNIAESVQMEYDANLIAHLWNGAHEMGDKATLDMFHTVPTADGPERRPIVEINVGKNKITSFKSKIYQKFFPASSDFREHPIQVALALQEQVEQEKKSKKSGWGNGRPIFEG